jgi:hypothetical protein
MTAGAAPLNDTPLDEKDKVAAKEAAKARRERLVDDAIEDSFPASDPPSFMGASATGAPRNEKRKSVKSKESSHQAA